MFISGESLLKKTFISSLPFSVFFFITRSDNFFLIIVVIPFKSFLLQK